MRILTISDFRKAIRNGAYAWPGGYPCYFLMEGGDTLSFEAAKRERRQILESFRPINSSDGWRPIAFDVNWEDDEMYCSHTGEKIDCAYGPDDNDDLTDE